MSCADLTNQFPRQVILSGPFTFDIGQVLARALGLSGFHKFYHTANMTSHFISDVFVPEDFYNLFEDRAFVDHFNVFLMLPVIVCIEIL